MSTGLRSPGVLNTARPSLVASHQACCLTPPLRALFVRNLPFNISAEEMYDIFGKYGPIRQVRM